MIGLNRDCLLYIPLLYYFVKTTQGQPTFAESRARHGSSEPFELGFISESIVEYPIMSDSARSSTTKIDPENDLEQILHSVHHAISSRTPALRPARARVAHNPSLLPRIGTVAKSPIGWTASHGLVEPLLVRMCDSKRVCIEENISMHMARVSQRNPMLNAAIHGHQSPYKGTRESRSA